MPSFEPGWVPLTPITVEIPEDVGPLKDALTAHLETLRAALFFELGVRFPAALVREGPELADGVYRLFLNELPVGTAGVKPGMYLVGEPAEQLSTREFDCIAAVNPATHRPSAWVGQADVAELQEQGLKALDAAQVIAQHLGAVLTRHARTFVKVQAVQRMLDALEGEAPALVKAVVPGVVTLLQLTEVLGRLVEEEVSIRDLPAILQTIGEQHRPGMPMMKLTEEVRTSLRQLVSHRFAHHPGTMLIYLLDPAIEEAIRSSIRSAPDGSPYLALEPELAQEIVQAVSAEVRQRPAQAPRPVILTTAEVRRYVRKLLEFEFAPPFTVVSYSELSPELNIEPVARIRLPTSAS